MKRIYILFFLLFFGLLQTFAASEAEYGKLSKTYTLNNDGSQEYRYNMELTLFTHTAMNRTYGETFIVYNPEYQELKIHTSYTKQKDGTLIQTPENAFVEVLPRQAAKAPAFNHLKEMVVVHTGLELGATIYLDYSILTKPGYLPELDICETIAQSSPVKEYTIALKVPENKSLFYELFNSTVKPTTTSSNGTKEVVWKIHNLPAASRAPQVTDLSGDVVLLTASSFASNKDALAHLNKQIACADDVSTQTISRTVTEWKRTETEKLHAILNYVIDDLDISNLKLNETGFKLRSMDEIHTSAYGTEVEKVKLLAGLLNAAGIKAEVVAAYSDNADINSYGLSAIHELFVIANTNEKQYFLSPKQKKMAEAAWYTGYAQYVSVSNPGNPVTIQTPPVELNYNYTITMEAEKADIQVVAKTGEAFIPYTEDYIIQHTAKDKNGKEEKSNGFSTFIYSTTETLKDTERYIVYSLPDASNSFSHTPYKNYNSKRYEHLLLPYKAKESYTYSIQLPDYIELRTPATTKKINNKAGTTSVSVRQHGNTIEVTRTLEIKNQQIKPDDFAAFRALMTEWADNNQLLFYVDYSKREKELYIPQKAWGIPEENDYNDENSSFNYKHMASTANVAILWQSSFGSDPSKNPDKTKRFDVNETLREAERFYTYYTDVLKFVHKGKSLSDRYKLVIFVLDDEDQTAYGGGADKKIGAAWFRPARMQNAPYCTLAHEMAHSFQYLLSCDNGGDGYNRGVGTMIEMAAQWSLWQVYPEWQTYENYHLNDFIKKTHFAFLHPTNMYHSPYVLEYWSAKHGPDIVAKIHREINDDEDPVMTYKRITNTSQKSFNDEIFDAATKFITWDFDRIRETSKPYINQHICKLKVVNDDWYQIPESNCLQNYGYNGIRLMVPTAGTHIKLQFKGIAGAEGYNAIETDKAGWRYGFVAYKSNGERVYGKRGADAEGELSFIVPKDTEYLWLVVSGAPTEHWKNQDEQWPYQIKLTGTSPDASVLNEI